MRRKENGSGRPRGDRRPGGKPHVGRRVPPADRTFEEGRYIRELKDAESLIEVTLSDDRKVRGTITYYDRDMIKLAPEEGPTIFVRKSDIRMIAELG